MSDEKKEKVVKGRFGNKKVSIGLIEDILTNQHVMGVICIAKYTDESFDIFSDGQMVSSDIAFASILLAKDCIDISIK